MRLQSLKVGYYRKKSPLWKCGMPAFSVRQQNQKVWKRRFCCFIMFWRLRDVKNRCYANAIETHSLGPKNRVESENRIGFALRSRFDTVTGDWLATQSSKWPLWAAPNHICKWFRRDFFTSTITRVIIEPHATDLNPLRALSFSPVFDFCSFQAPASEERNEQNECLRYLHALSTTVNAMEAISGW